MDRLPRVFFSPFPASLLIGARVFLLAKSAVSPPPWMQKPARCDERWCRRMAVIDIAQEILDRDRRLLGNSYHMKSPCEVQI